MTTPQSQSVEENTFEREIRTEFNNWMSNEWVKNGGDFYPNKEQIAGWWLKKLHSHTQGVKMTVEKYKEKACFISDFPEYDETNMVMYIENPTIRALVWQYIEAVRDLEQLLSNQLGYEGINKTSENVESNHTLN